MAGGAPKGNNNGGKNKAWTNALRRELEGKQNADKLANMAKKLVDLAVSEGNMQAFKEIGDRLEGKPVQAIEGTGDNGQFIVSISVDDSSVL